MGAGRLPPRSAEITPLCEHIHARQAAESQPSPSQGPDLHSSSPRTCVGGARGYAHIVSDPVVVRTARLEDAENMARVIVRSWQETYRGLVPDDVLDDPGFLAARTQFWTSALTDGRSPSRRIAVAEHGGRIIGVAMSGPPQDPDAAWTTQLHVLYVHAKDHGTGAGAALLDRVVLPSESAALWVADPNPRAHAFYRKHGFLPDGAHAVEGGIQVVRMVRAQPQDG